LKILLFLNVIILYIEALVPSFHKPLKTSGKKFFGLLSELGGDLHFHRYHDEGHDMLARIVTGDESWVSCKYGIEPSGSMKFWEVLEWLPN
jgi:hypothetical protein